MKPTITEILQDNQLSSARLMLDSGQSCRILQQGLPMFYRNGYKLLSCEPIIKKYKSGKRLVLQYRLKVQSHPQETKELLVLGKIYNSDRGAKITRQIHLLNNYL